MKLAPNICQTDGHFLDWKGQFSSLTCSRYTHVASSNINKIPAFFPHTEFTISSEISYVGQVGRSFEHVDRHILCNYEPTPAGTARCECNTGDIVNLFLCFFVTAVRRL